MSIIDKTTAHVVAVNALMRALGALEGHATYEETRAALVRALYCVGDVIEVDGARVSIERGDMRAGNASAGRTYAHAECAGWTLDLNASEIDRAPVVQIETPDGPKGEPFGRVFINDGTVYDGTDLHTSPLNAPDPMPTGDGPGNDAD